MGLDRLEPMVAAGVRGVLGSEAGAEPGLTRDTELGEVTESFAEEPTVTKTRVQMKATGRTF